ncbi:MAG: cation:proton antiporter [Ignisphaera sp.]|nr:cation:proton antiporter [Ignisphaera sp.]MCX8168330.1 cation:proton antiporter [Ignisphaera sp.]MDW8085337.1 cation:proton antiporter [Ignisphaera sp.]
MHTLSALVLFSFGIISAWTMRRVGLPDTLGYILGGFIAAPLLMFMGVDASNALAFIDPLKWLGLILFVFEVGASLGLRGLSRTINRVVAAELISYVVIWLLSGLVALSFNMDTPSRLVIFMVMVNSSTAVVASVRSRSSSQGISEGVMANIVVQTNFEDLAQFILFTIFMSTSFALTRPTQVAWLVFSTIATAALFITTSRFVLGPIMASPLVRERDGKFLLSITVAILFGAVAKFVGLPELFGAFIGGAAFAYFHSIDDIADLLRGPRDIGLLLYFTTLGLQLYLDVAMEGIKLSIITGGLIIGFAAIAARLLGMFIGSGLSGSGLREAIILTLSLSPLSEMGIILTDSLAMAGLVSRNLVSILSISVLTTLVFFGFTLPMGLKKLARIESIVPPKLVMLFELLSREYMRHVEITVSLLSTIVEFFIVLLAISYLNTISGDLTKIFRNPIHVSLVISVISIILILVVLISVLRRIYKTILISTPHRVQSVGEVTSRLLDVLVGGLAIAFQIYLAFESIIRLGMIESLYRLSLVVISIAIVSITIYEVYRYLKYPASRAQ